ncbi:amidohydrolase family protein [Paraburkholderia sp. CNPSo 3155]|uniref:amidohydrolase family protein n=1 Tax=Paraburkholderia atlantica TaxID=2654982 RepID=UPI00128CCE8F|nr:amidohydrolase family protein [Paraburkholderia atlantica]MPW10241.1 amidohydrolase family protein [Paraburkholderia atlantica]
MIDSHAHLISTDVEKYPPSPLSGTLEANAFDNPVTAERLIDLLDAYGVEKALAVQRAHLYGFHNDYVVDSAEQYPDRLRSLCMIDALADNVEETVRYWVGQRGSVGIRLTEPNKGADSSWFASKQALRAWSAVSELGGSVRLHFYRWNRVAALEALQDVVKQFPNTPVILDHFSNIVGESGAPDYGVDEALLKFVDSPNVYLLYSMINLGKLKALELPAAPVVERVVRSFGADRVMWGSDIAQSKGEYKDMIQLAKDSVSSLSEADQRKVLHTTAERVYFS